MLTPEIHTVIVQPLFHIDDRRRPPVQLMQMGTVANNLVPTRIVDGQSLGVPVDKLADLTAALQPRLVGISMLSPTFECI